MALKVKKTLWLPLNCVWWLASARLLLLLKFLLLLLFSVLPARVEIRFRRNCCRCCRVFCSVQFARVISYWLRFFRRLLLFTDDDEGDGDDDDDYSWLMVVVVVVVVQTMRKVQVTATAKQSKAKESNTRGAGEQRSTNGGSKRTIIRWVMSADGWWWSLGKRGCHLFTDGGLLRQIVSTIARRDCLPDVLLFRLLLSPFSAAAVLSHHQQSLSSVDGKCRQCRRKKCASDDGGGLDG